MLARIKTVLSRLLETVVVSLVVSLTAVVVVAVVYRKAGASLSWYDEVASVLLAWVTYYGAALAALKRQHIGFDGIVRAVSPAWRLLFVIVSEIAVLGFFALLAWAGWIVLNVLQGDTLVSLPWVPVQVTQSVIPIGAVLFIVCELISLPEYWRDLREGGLPSEVAAHLEPKP
jgi:TRAP-type C4-dicarboxylate transport system permease small subunit